MYYYQFTAFILKGEGIGVLHGTVLCTCIASSIPIENTLENTEKISNIILEEIKKMERYQTAHKIRIDSSKEISNKTFEKRKIRIMVTS